MVENTLEQRKSDNQLNFEAEMLAWDAGYFTADDKKVQVDVVRKTAKILLSRNPDGRPAKEGRWSMGASTKRTIEYHLSQGFTVFMILADVEKRCVRRFDYKSLMILQDGRWWVVETGGAKPI